MDSLSNFIWFSNLVALRLISAQQFYDTTDCNSESSVQGSRYLCNLIRKSCPTYIIYRAQQNYQNVSSISSLFGLDHTQILELNNLTSPSQDVQINREILVPIECSCSGRYSQANLSYLSSGSQLYSEIACETFEGLSKSQTLAQQNPYAEGKLAAGLKLRIPLKCACPDNRTRTNGVKFLVTYPIVRNDDLISIASKFNVSQEEIWAANKLEGPNPTVYPRTTVLVPVKKIPVLIPSSPVGPSPNPRPVIPLKTTTENKSKKQRSIYIVLGVAVSAAIILLTAIAAFSITSRYFKSENAQPPSAKSSQLSCLSPDLLAGMSQLKHPLFSYSFEELKVATGDFSEASKISNSIYRGRIDGSEVAIEQMGLEEAHGVIDVLTTINHVNIVRLQCWCYRGGDLSRPFLVFESAERGCLRDCLSDKSRNLELRWGKRMQIAFDVAVGLHYIHHCTSPAYVHRNINSRNILITGDWRAKIAGFRHSKPVSFAITGSKKEKAQDHNTDDMIRGRKGYLAPEYLLVELVSPKVDVFAFGVVLLELISAREAVNESLLKDSLGFLADEGGIEASSVCLDELKDFVDPSLDGDFPLGDALCLALLAKACVEEDPSRRPTMNDVLKAISRMI